MGRFDEAMKEIKTAQRLDPLSLIISTVFATITYNAVDSEEAADALLKYLELFGLRQDNIQLIRGHTPLAVLNRRAGPRSTS